MTLKKSITLTPEADLLSYTGRRLSVRRVDDHFARKMARNRATATGHPITSVTSGGSVANSYNYPASTEGIVTVAFPCGSVVQWGCRLPAKGVTKGGISAACLGSRARPLADYRYGDRATELSRAWVIGHAAGVIFAAKEKEN